MNRQLSAFQLIAIGAWTVSLFLLALVRDWEWSAIYVAVWIQAGASTLAMYSALMRIGDDDH